MFDPAPAPRVFGLAPGVDFPRALVDGLMARQAGQPPEALARVTLIVNTRRMARRIRALFDAGPALLLPRIRQVTEPLGAVDDLDVPAAIPALRRRLELVQLVARLLDRAPDLAPRAALYDLSDSLAALMDEMQGEGVAPDVLDRLDVGDLSGHWQRALEFLRIVQRYFDDTGAPPDPQARQRRLVERLAQTWARTPPADPVIVAGSTGSRGTTLRLMQAVAGLPQGALVLPGFDFDMPARGWADLDDALTAEDHPQFRFRRIIDVLGIAPGAIRPWHDAPPPAPARNRAVSLALRPAPVTDRWLAEGPHLTGLDSAFDAVTLVEAPGPRDEAQVIALRLRQAAEDGQTAALITPDRMLGRQVTAALDRWNILPDDSAGTPLQLSPPGRFLQHVATLFLRPTPISLLLTLLKHPLTHTGADRGPHLRLTHELELHLRRNGPPCPARADLLDWAAGRPDPEAPGWAAWVADTMTGQDAPEAAPLGGRLAHHLALADRIAAGPGAAGSGLLWDRAAGIKAREIVTELAENADVGGDLTAHEYADLFGAVLSRGEVRDRDAPHPAILIWGTLEARVQGADLLILGGLNEGSWPEMPPPDPWLNRALRHQAGLLLPERRIGLSAHDFQQAIAAPEVWLTRAARSDDAQTVPSRWLNRLTNLMRGLPGQGGDAAWDAMKARGDDWLARARRLDIPEHAPPAPRPAPRPPVAARPRELPVTAIQRLIRDPYAIYARYILRLKPLDPLEKAPDALLRGIIVHDVIERFSRDHQGDPALLTPDHLLTLTRDVLTAKVPWASARALWQARIGRVSDWFVQTEAARLRRAAPLGFEIRGRAPLAGRDFTLTAKADRMDRDAGGHVYIYDYKTGKPPGAKEQAHFDKQLLLEAAMVERGAFEAAGASRVAGAVYIGLGTNPEERAAPLEDEPPARVWAEFEQLIGRYFDPEQGYSARRAMRSEKDAGDYDQLARFGEWDITEAPEPQDLT